MKNVIECLNIWIVPFALIRAVCLKLDEKKKLMIMFSSGNWEWSKKHPQFQMEGRKPDM